MRGQFIGVPGGGLTGDNDWAQASKGAQQAGRDAEVRTGQTLAAVVERGATVLNDLRIPIPGFSANIDQVIVYGSHVIVLDAKAWTAGRYWTFNGKTRRGFGLMRPPASNGAERLFCGLHMPHCDKKTIPTAVDALRRHLSKAGIEATFERPVLAVWQERPTSFRLYRPPGNPRVVRGHRLAAWARRTVKSQPADPNIVRALAQLVN